MSHSNQSPGLPEIVDEAGDTPNWVPIVGLALVVVVALLIAVHQAMGGGEAGAAAAAEAADAGSAPAEPAAAAAAKPDGAERPAQAPRAVTARPIE